LSILDTWNYSFGKFLELSFYSFDAVCRTGSCSHSVHRDHIRYFSRGCLVAQFAYEPIDLLQVTIPPLRLVHDPNMKVFLRSKELELLYQCAEQVYEAILAKLRQLESDTSRLSVVHAELCQQVHTFIKSLSDEKVVFMAKLANVQTQVVDESTADPLKDLTRTLYASFITWNSTLNELVNNVSTNEYKPKYQSKRVVSNSFIPNHQVQGHVSDSSPRPVQDNPSIIVHADGVIDSPMVAPENVYIKSAESGEAVSSEDYLVSRTPSNVLPGNAITFASISKLEEEKRGGEDGNDVSVPPNAYLDNEAAAYQQPNHLSQIPSGSSIFGSNDILECIYTPYSSTFCNNRSNLRFI
jgi:hypothetical protein